MLPETTTIILLKGLWWFEHTWQVESDTIRRLGLTGGGVILLEEVCHCGGWLWRSPPVLIRGPLSQVARKSGGKGSMFWFFDRRAGWPTACHLAKAGQQLPLCSALKANPHLTFRVYADLLRPGHATTCVAAASPSFSSFSSSSSFFFFLHGWFETRYGSLGWPWISHNIPMSVSSVLLTTPAIPLSHTPYLAPRVSHSSGWSQTCHVA